MPFGAHPKFPFAKVHPSPKIVLAFLTLLCFHCGYLSVCFRVVACYPHDYWSCDLKKIINHSWCLLHLFFFLLIFGFFPLNIVLICSHWSLTSSCSSSNPFPLHYTIVFLFIKLWTPPYNVFMFGPSSFHLLPFHHGFFLKFILFLFIFQSLLPLALLIICLFEVFASMM